MEASYSTEGRRWAPRGSDGFERGGGAQAAQTGSGEGHARPGERVAQGGQGSGPAKPHGAARVRGCAQEVGGGKDLLVALSEQEDEPMDYERLRARAEAFVYAAMIRLMVRRLARARGFSISFSTHSAE